jgi:hypothetical protein
MLLDTRITASALAGKKKNRRSTHLLGFLVVVGGGVADLDVLVGSRVEDFDIDETGGSFVASIQ